MTSPLRLFLTWLVALISVTHAGTLLFTNGIVVTVTGPSLTNASVFVRDGRIESVGMLAAGKADQVINLQGMRLFPGLIAPSTVLGLMEIDSLRPSRDTTEVGEFSPDVAAWVAVNPDSELIPVARANGYTHAQVIPLGGLVSGVSAVIQLQGWTIEDLTVRKKVALHLRWPTFSVDTTTKEQSGNQESWKSIEEQAEERNKTLRKIDAFFSDASAYAGAKTAAGTGAFQTVPAWEAMLPFLQRDLPLWIHADEVRQIRSAVEWLGRRKLRGVISGGRDAWREASLLATNAISVVFEHVFTQPVRDTDAYDTQFTAASILARAGVSVAFGEGTDRFGASSIRNVPYAAAQARAFGLPYEQAIRGLTLYPARLLGLDKQLGSIEAGKDATLILVDGDILDLRSKVKRQWITGVEQDLSSRHTRLHDRYKSRPKPLAK